MKSNDPTAPFVEIDFAELSDGTLVEMIQSPADPTESLLAVYKDGNVQYAEQWRDETEFLSQSPGWTRC